MRTPAQIWDAAARRVALKIFRLAHQPPARYVPIPLAAMPWRDRPFLKRTAAALVALGFRDIGCMRMETGAGQAGDGLRYRLLATAQGDIRATVAVVRARRESALLLYLWLKLRRRLPKPRPFVEFTTTLDTGAVIDTSNSGDRNPFTPPPDYATVRMPADTPLPVQLATHRRHVAALLRAHPGSAAVDVVDMQSYERVRELERVRRNRYRQSIGYVTDDELRGLAREHHADIRDGVRTELARLARENDAQGRAPEPATRAG